MTFNSVVELVQEFTSDRRRLGVVLENLPAYGGTALHDAVIEGLALVHSLPSEGKALVIITDGADTVSGSSLKDALTAARREETPIYSIGLGHRRPHGGFGADDDFDDRPLRKLAEETGGDAEILLDVEHHHRGEVDRIKEAAESVALALRHRYVLAYYPPAAAGPPQWKEIRVEVDRPSVTVRARKGYYAAETRSSLQ